MNHAFETFIHSFVHSFVRVRARRAIGGATRTRWYYSVLVIQAGRRDADASPHAAEETTERLGHLDALGVSYGGLGGRRTRAKGQATRSRHRFLDRVRFRVRSLPESAVGRSGCVFHLEVSNEFGKGNPGGFVSIRLYSEENVLYVQ